jgi:DNA-binding NtrC family response regulator
MSCVHDTRRDRRQALIVDDDESIRSLLNLFFEQEGYEVETVENGERALERFEAGRFHLVMLDYYMPGMNGLELASAIHVQDPGVTIALITGMAHTLANADLASIGITKVFSKPFDMCEMATWLQSLSDLG